MKDNNTAGTPVWAKCETCLNKDSWRCLSCAIKFPTSPYLNYVSEKPLYPKSDTTYTE